MAFHEIEVIGNGGASEHTGVSVGLTVLKKSNALLRVQVKPAVMEAIGWNGSEKLVALIGDDEHFGILRLRSQKSGSISFIQRRTTSKTNRGNKSTKYFQVNLGYRPEFVNRSEKAGPCEWEKIDPDTIEIVLPDWADETRPKTKKAVVAASPAAEAAKREQERLAREAEEAEQRRAERAKQEEREIRREQAAP